MTMSQVRDHAVALLADQDGAAAIEYALIAGGIVVGIIALVYQLGGTVVGQYEAVDSALN